MHITTVQFIQDEFPVHLMKLIYDWQTKPLYNSETMNQHFVLNAQLTTKVTVWQEQA